MTVDRRRTHRLACDLPVEWRRGWLTVAARIRDFDPEGLFVETSHSVPPGQTMDLVVALPDGELRITGVARYVGTNRHGRGVGVAILAITTEDLARWRACYERAAAALPAPAAPARAATRV